MKSYELRLITACFALLSSSSITLPVSLCYFMFSQLERLEKDKERRVAHVNKLQLSVRKYVTKGGGVREGDGVAGHSEVHVTRTRRHLVTRDLGG